MSDSLVTPCTVALQASLSMGFPRQEYWSGSPFPSPGDLPNPGIKLGFPALWVDSLPAELPGKPLKHSNFLLIEGQSLAGELERKMTFREQGAFQVSAHFYSAGLKC